MIGTVYYWKNKWRY